MPRSSLPTRHRHASILAMLLLPVIPHPAHAAWPNSPNVNVPISVATTHKYAPVIATDGNGGAIMTWYDYRSGNADIYAQHVLASGIVDPAWPVNGRALCTATNEQANPTIAPDGSGGAIVTWHDLRSGVYQPYAQHVLATGVVDPAWPVNGRQLCNAAGGQFNPTVVGDGAGGAIVSWQDARSGTYDIYAAHVLATGALDPAWPVDGRGLCVVAGDQTSQKLVSDGAGGAVVTWQDMRGANQDIYAAHVLANGTVDPAWPVNGRALCLAANAQANPTIVSDGTGGAIVTWEDNRAASTDIYAQHVLAGGAVDSNWPTDGRALCAAANTQSAPVLTTDLAGGAIVAWQDIRTGNVDIYAQHVFANGIVDPAWPIDGRGVCLATSNQFAPSIISDGSGGALVGWYDFRSGATDDIYAARVLANGLVDTAWPVDGRAVSTASGHQVSPYLVADDRGGAILVWNDTRNSFYNVYAQRVARYGYLGTPEAEIVDVQDVPGDQGGKVKVSFHASYLEGDPYNVVTYYNVFRSAPPNAAQAALRGERALRDIGDLDVPLPGVIYRTRLAGVTYYWELIGTVAANYLPNYSTIASTTQDSIGAGNPKTAFMIQARTAASAQHWESLPDSGYSVDNLPPAAPAPFAGQYFSGAAHLHWDPNAEVDIAGYRLYRGSSAGFVPGPGNLVSAQPDTGYADHGAAGSWYKLSAVDSHGNESPFATLGPSGTTDVPHPPFGFALWLAGAVPNPAIGAAEIQFTLPQEAFVRVRILDAAGRLVRDVSSARLPAGPNSVRWDARRSDGTSAPAGLYFVRLETAGRTLTRRMALMR